MAGSFGVRNVDDVPIARLKRLAARHGRSAMFEMCDILKQALQGAVDKDFERLATDLRKLNASRAQTPAEALQRARRVIVYDGNDIAIPDTKVGDGQRLSLDTLAYEAEILFLLGGHERHVPDPRGLVSVIRLPRASFEKKLTEYAKRRRGSRSACFDYPQAESRACLWAEG